jgi:signal transduction histidine kinase
LAWRLTLWYGGILILSLAVSFVVFFVVVNSVMRHRTDTWLMEEAHGTQDALRRGGRLAVTQELMQETTESGNNDIFFRIFDTAGQLLEGSDLRSWQQINFESHIPALTGERESSFQTWVGNGPHSSVRVLTTSLAPGVVLQLGFNETEDVRLMARSERLAALIMGVLVLMAVLVGWGTARRAVGDVELLTAAARDIASGKWDTRVPVTPRGDEIEQLAVTFNIMIDRVNAILTTMRQTNDNIAHELRSPIARMRGWAETTLMRPNVEAHARDMAATTVEACDRLLETINGMLDIAEAETRSDAWPMGPVDLEAVLRDACELFDPVAEQKNISIRLESPGPCMVNANLHQLQRALANIIDNAVKYAPQGAAVIVLLNRAGPQIVATVKNPGPGILPADLPHIFERFFRGEASRTVSGSGLGLSLAHAIIQAHSGTIKATSMPGQWTEFTLCLPAATVSQTPTAPARQG